MKISCADFTFPLLSHGAAMQLIKSMGIDAVDLGLFADRFHIRPENVRGNPVAAAKEIRSRLDDLGLGLADVFLQNSIDPADLPANHPNPSVRDKTRELMKIAIELTAAAGGTHITGLPGVSLTGIADDDSLKRAADEATWRAAAAAEAGLIYAIEPHLGSICQTPAATLDFLKRSQNVTITLDWSHFTYQDIPFGEVVPLIPHASHLHARGSAPGRLQTAVDENQIDFPAILRELERIGYDGYIGLEYVWVVWGGCNRCDTVSETILLKQLLNQHAA